VGAIEVGNPRHILDLLLSRRFFYEKENFWLTQKAMAALFCMEVPALSKHLANIFATNELLKE